MRFYTQETVDHFSGKTVVITGCSRGLGLELAEQLLGCQAKVVATCRNPQNAPKLDKVIEYADPGKNGFVLPCDVSDANSITTLGKLIQEKCGGSRIDVLINNAGISNPDHPKDPIVSASLEDMQSVFQTNVMGTVLMTQEMLPLMKDQEGQPEGLKMIVNMSSQLGSIQNTFGCQGRMGGVACYRMSRAANNMALRTFAGELSEEKFRCVAMSPGHVATDMGSSGGRNPPLQPIDSIGGILKVLSSMKTEDNGRFL